MPFARDIWIWIWISLISPHSKKMFVLTGKMFCPTGQCRVALCRLYMQLGNMKHLIMWSSSKKTNKKMLRWAFCWTLVYWSIGIFSRSTMELLVITTGLNFNQRNQKRIFELNTAAIHLHVPPTHTNTHTRTLIHVCAWGCVTEADELQLLITSGNLDSPR